MEDKIVLDEKSFKALSADSRVSILKRLNERRMTLSELSHRLNLKGSTIKEHCTVLLNAELIKKIDEGRKWKYYELTGKGKQIVAPNLFEEARVLVTLCFSAIIFIVFMFFILGGITNASMTGSANVSEHQILKSVGTDTGFYSDEVTTIAGANEKDTNITTIEKTVIIEKTDYFTYMIAIITALTAGILIGWVGKKRFA